MLIALYLYAAELSAHSISGYCNLPSRGVSLDFYAPAVQVFGRDDAELTPRVRPTGEFVDLELTVAYLKPREPWLPDTVEEAAFALREMLPNEFYLRLVESYDLKNRRMMTSGDSAINQRLSDLARYLEEAWGLGWSDSQDSFEALALILDYIKAPDSSMAPRCRPVAKRRAGDMHQHHNASPDR